MPLKLRPMSEFDPTRPAFVHDALNNKILDWEPEWAAHYREHAIFDVEGTVGWGARILVGWRPRIEAV